MSKIIIGVEDDERSRDAIAFGEALARGSRAPVTVAHAYPSDPLLIERGGDLDEALRAGARSVLARVSAPLRDLPGLETEPIADSSPARGLQELAARQRAGLIVVGSSHVGRLGRVLPGSTAERLLHGAPCPVAVVPTGYAERERGRSGVVACGWNGTRESDAALAAAEELARTTAASLRVIRVFQPTVYAYPPALAVNQVVIARRERADAERALEDRVAHLDDATAAVGELHEGLAASELTDVSAWVDLLVLGSRGYGPLRAVLLGGVSGQVLQNAQCPVIVVPNGVTADVGSIFSTQDQASVMP